VAAAFIKKYSWEPRTQLTTMANVEQPDADHFTFFRRTETVMSEDHSYEKVTYNRKDKSITSELISLRPHGYRVYDKSVISE